MWPRVAAALALISIGCGDGSDERHSSQGFDDLPDPAAEPAAETMAPSGGREDVTGFSSPGPENRTKLVDGGAAACWGETTCGGNLVGRWRVSAMCADTEALAPEVTGCDDLVESVRFTPDDYTVEFTEDTWTISGWLTTKEVMNYTDICLSSILGQPARVTEASCLGLAGSAASCEVLPSQCRCEITRTVRVDEVDSYRIHHGRIVNGQSNSMDYCVQGDSLRMTDGVRHLVLTRLD